MSLVAKEKSTKWSEAFKLVSKARLGAASPLINEMQEKAINAFSEIGLPDKKVEDYKYTNIKLYLNDEFDPANEPCKLKAADIKHLIIKGHATFVLVNGIFVAELSNLENIPKEVTVKSLFAALADGDAFASKHFNKQVEQLITPMGMLNTGLATGGIFINVPTKYNCTLPIHVLNISSSDKKTLASPRNLIHLGAASTFTVIESYYSINNTGKTFTNSVTEIVVEKEATLNCYSLQDEGANAAQSNIHEISMDTSSRLNNTVITLNGALVRNDLNVLLHGEHTEIHLNGLFVQKGTNHTDNHTLVEHFSPNCFSNELYKGVIADSATGVFNGKIYVHSEAQKTNAYQSNKNVLIGDKATVNTKPQLEIYADDVRCTHGTTTGRLNEEALFYLQSRGLNKNLARRVLLEAFANEVIDTVKDEAFKSHLEQRMQGHIV
jgi:Fe-S cluster assembly protein SufD